VSHTIALLGDVMLGRAVGERLAHGDPAEVWAPEVRDLCAECDLVVVNLECCLSTRGSRTRAVPRKPFFFRGPPRAVGTLEAIGVDVAGLANNHALDFGADALEDTLGILTEAGITAVGAAGSPGEARAAVVVGDSPSLGVLALSDHPRVFAATDRAPGIAYADMAAGLPEWVRDELARLREEADLVLAFLHWGPNMTTAPARWQRERARELLAAGADVVAGHSAHVFHGVERDAEGLVLYDLGDALDDYAVDEYLRNDLGIFAIWRPEEEPPLELVGLRLDFCHTRLAEGVDAEWIAERLEAACAELGTTVSREAEQRFQVG
jgi:poly-gamma-glutamate capsule biosynthesis protein CapA/YwtB (metallophosphatase superfamily)